MSVERPVVSLVSTGRGSGELKWHVKIFYTNGGTEYLNGFSTEQEAVAEARRIRELNGLGPAGSAKAVDVLAVDLILAKSRRDEGIPS